MRYLWRRSVRLSLHRHWRASGTNVHASVQCRSAVRFVPTVVRQSTGVSLYRRYLLLHRGDDRKRDPVFTVSIVRHDDVVNYGAVDNDDDGTGTDTVVDVVETRVL